MKSKTKMSMKVRKWPVIGCVLAVVWLFIKGTTLTPENVLGTFLVGLTVGLFVAYATRNVYADKIDIGATLQSVPAAVRYLLLFLKELLVANLDVAYRVLSPSLPIDPDVVAIPLRVESDPAITTIANSITLTPGTLTMDYDEETNTLFVHAITGKHDYYSIVNPVRAWEDLALVIFEESASPDDPAPEWPDPGNPTARDGGERDGE
jgi:multicomponent Na+:H+ antiporter subunit E